MKFGRNLPRNQVPEWSSFYINYKGLKKLIKAAEGTAKRGEKVDLAEFFFALDRNLEDVDNFYNKKYSETHRRLRAVRDRYGSTPDVSNLDQDEVEDLMGALLELRNQLRNLQWFGDINRRGFIKITKKLDKRIPDTVTQDRYIATKVDPKPFARDTALVRLLSDVNKWIQVLGDSQEIDDDKSDRSARSARSIGRASAKAMLNLPQNVLEQLDQAIRKDDVKTLGEVIAAHANVGDGSTQGLLLSLLQRSISSRSKASIDYLLRHVKSLDEADDINGRNCIHRLVIHMGRAASGPPVDKEPSSYPFPTQTQRAHYGDSFLTPAASPMAAPRLTQIKESNTMGGGEEPLKILSFILDRLFEKQREALTAKDSFGRFPLHYAAQFGFVDVCQKLMAKMQEWGQFSVDNGIDAPEWQDKDNYAPLHLAVIGGHPLTTQTLLRAENWQGIADNKLEARKCVSSSGAVLSIATKHNYFKIVEMLVDAGVDINWQNETGETALHVAARFGYDDCAKVLLEGSDSQKANIELAEQTFGWTPLHIAAVDGHLSVIKLLIEAGADVDKPDSGGWTAKEHAALRGHLKIAALLLDNSLSDSLVPTEADDAIPTPGTSPPETSMSIGDRRSAVAPKSAEPRPIKTYGHRYLKGETLVLVSLGSMDMRKNLEAVKLDKVPLAQAHYTQLDTALSVVVSASGASGDPTVVDLPVHDNIMTEPMLFTTQDAASVKLLFDIVPTYSGNDKNKIGRATAMLSHVRPSIGSKRANLQGDVCVPIISPNLDCIGTVNFNFLVITPFVHPKMEVTSEQTYWRRMTSSTMVIGHRGLGKNVASNRSLQLGENTVQSFIAAANLGANYVEFDVQLTKDHVPVIYHDFLVSETGFDAPVHTLTLEQFLHINPDRNRKKDKSSTSKIPAPANTDAPARDPSAYSRRGRSMSMKVTHSERRDKDAADELEERMKHTRAFKEKGFKANTRGNFIQAPFATLEDLFLQLPVDVGFNIEMKYPMLHESEEHEMDTYAVEMNSFCDTVLEKVYDLATRDGGTRNVIFSSFNPDICLCLSFKQPNYPIMFLTDAGSEPVGDIRASSLQEAVRFAGRWNLLGIVSMSEPLVNSPRLIRIVKGSGLVCVSYGAQNNNSDLVQRQVKEDIDAVIVDSVFAIRKGLRGEGEEVKGEEGKSEAAKAISEMSNGVVAGVEGLKIS